jgi:hypothetical protein
MDRESPHPDALRNFDRARIPENKIREYALRNPSKKRPFEALGFSLEADNWETLRNAILEGLSVRPATFNKVNEWGTYFAVLVPVRGPDGKEAPVWTYWIYRWGEDFPRLATLYIDTDEWARWELEGEDAS